MNYYSGRDQRRDQVCMGTEWDVEYTERSKLFSDIFFALALGKQHCELQASFALLESSMENPMDAGV